MIMILSRMLFLSEMCEKNNISTIDDFINIYGYPNEVYADEYTMELVGTD